MRESKREGEVWRKCTSPDKSIGIYSTVTAGVQAAVPERDQGPTQAGRGNENDGNENENENKKKAQFKQNEERSIGYRV